MINRQFLKYHMGNDPYNLYTQSHHPQNYTNFNPGLSSNQQLRPSSITPATKQGNKNLSFLSPARQKDRSIGYNESQITINSIPHTSYMPNNQYLKQLETSRINLQRTKSLTAPNFLIQSQIAYQNINQQPKKAPTILKKQDQKGFEKTFKIDPYHQQIDNIRISLRISKDRILEHMKPMIIQQVKDMYLTISLQKSNGFTNKNRVFFILAQKNHYMTLLDKLQDHFIKINQIINKLRRHDKLPQRQLQQMSFSKDTISKLLNSVQSDLPAKSWKVVLKNPQSKLYQLVVLKALKDQKILRQFQDLKKKQQVGDIENSHILNSSMMISSTQRAGSPPGSNNYNLNLTSSITDLKNNSNQSDIVKSNNNPKLTQSTKISQNNDPKENDQNSKKSSGNQYSNKSLNIQQPPARQTRFPFGQINRL